MTWDQTHSNDRRERRLFYFQAAGHRLTQDLLTLGMIIYLLGSLAEIIHLSVGKDGHFTLVLLARPAVVVFLWFLQRLCFANTFAVVALTAAFMAAQRIYHLHLDTYALIRLVGLITVAVMASARWFRLRRNPIFALTDRSPTERHF